MMVDFFMISICYQLMKDRLHVYDDCIALRVDDQRNSLSYLQNLHEDIDKEI